MIADEKTGIYERKLIRKLLQADQQTNSAYRRLISDVAPILAQYRSSSRGVIINDPDLYRQLSSHIAIFRKRIEEMIRTNQSWAWALADDKNDQIINEYISNLPISNVAREGLFARNNQAFDNFQKRKYDGLQLSDRVWSLGKQNEDLLKDYLDNALITGRTADELSRDVRELLTEPNRLFRRVRNPKTGKLELSKAAQAYHPGRGMYRSSYMNAKRLARTEINMAYRTSDQERWKTLKFVLGYEVKLSNRHPAPDICDHAAGRYPKEFKFVGWHPQCLCYAVPILPDKKSFLDNLIDDVPLKGKVTDIPDSMKQYISDNLSRIAAYGKQPFWVQDNFKGGRIDGKLKKITSTPTGKTTPPVVPVTPPPPPPPAPAKIHIPTEFITGSDYLMGRNINFRDDFFALLDPNKQTILRIFKDDSGSFHNGNKVVIANHSRVKASVWEQQAVVYHEFGHAIDFQRSLKLNPDFLKLYGKVKKDLGKKSVRETWTWGYDYDAKAYRNKKESKLLSKIEYANYKLNRLYNRIGKMDESLFKKMGITKADVIEQICSTMDTIMSINPKYGFGHTRRYFSSVDKRYAEFIAHSFENTFLGNRIFQKYLPDEYKMMVEFIKTLKPL